MSAVAALLKNEAALIGRFRDTLRLEQEILRAGSSEELAKINAEKISLVENLNQAGIERARLLSSGQETTIDMSAWLSAHPGDKESHKLWEGLLKIAREAREINESNGSLINALHQKTSDALAILTHGENDQSLYRSNGQAASSTGSRIIDSA